MFAKSKNDEYKSVYEYLGILKDCWKVSGVDIEEHFFLKLRIIFLKDLTPGFLFKKSSNVRAHVMNQHSTGK